jgi:hypothetical protein
LFPDDDRSKVIYTHTKELAVRQAINNAFDGFVHDKVLKMETSHCECAMRRRIDHRKLINGTLLCVETDEHAHSGYDKEDEVNRYHDIMMIHGGKSVFIRFNVDGRGLSLKTKLNGLIDEMRAQIGRIERGENTELLEVVHLFYPKNFGVNETRRVPGASCRGASASV